MELDIFRLHQKEDEYGSMSYIIVKGNNLGKIVIELIWRIVKRRNITKKKLLLEISNKINVAYPTIERQVMKLKNYTYWISLAFLKEMVKVYNKCFSNEDINYIKNSLVSSFEKIKISNGNSLELKVVKELSTDLCILTGAHAADGCLHKKRVKSHHHYRVLIVDREYKAVEWYKNCLDRLFGLKAKIYKLQGSWMIHLSNKIVFRYLNIFFGFPIGKKSRIVKEPKLIKYSPFIYRKAFAKGVMTFDGSVTTFGVITIGMKSKNLINSLYNILKKDGVEVIYSSNKENTVWYLKTSSRLDKKQLNRWLCYFIDGTGKYKRVNWLLNGFPIKPKTINETIDVFKNNFPKDNRSKISIAYVLKVMIYNKKLFIWEITEKLKKGRNLDSLSHTPIKMYLHVLENQANIIKSENKLAKFNKSASKSKLYSLNPFSYWRIP